MPVLSAAAVRQIRYSQILLRILNFGRELWWSSSVAMAFSKSWLLCLLGFLIVSQQCIQLARAEEAAADDDAGEYEDDEVPEAAPEPPVVEKSDKNVLVLGKSNFDKVCVCHWCCLYCRA
jgi:hypothetical protein